MKITKSYKKLQKIAKNCKKLQKIAKNYIHTNKFERSKPELAFFFAVFVCN